MAYDLCWVSSRHYQLRYVSGYHAASSDHASSTDVNALKDQRVHSNENVIIDGDRNGYPGVRAVSPKFWRQWMEVRVHDDDICSNRDPGSDVERLFPRTQRCFSRETGRNTAFDHDSITGLNAPGRAAVSINVENHRRESRRPSPDFTPP